jgi:ABC-2 type transport system permease protein
MNNTLLIIRREYLERVMRKSFILTTILTPIFMVLLMVAPTLVMIFSNAEVQRVAVVDRTGVIARQLQSDESVKFVPVDLPADSLRNDNAYDAILVIERNAIDDPTTGITYSAHGSTPLATQQIVKDQIERVIEHVRLSNYKIDNLQQIIADVKANVVIRTFDLDKSDETETSPLLSYVIGAATSMILYMFIVLYGQMVMTSIIEEKSNRVLEVVVSSIKPSRLMLGKVLGIGAVALTQIAIWGVLIVGFSMWVMPSLVAMAGTAAAGDAEAMAMLSAVSDAGGFAAIFGWMVLFLILGYLFYSALYAAIGSAVDNVQDASQLTVFTMIPILLGFVISMTVINDPGSTLAMWTSMIPFTSPMVMMARIPFGVPVWQILLSLVILVLSVWLVVQVAAKIYRVGIFMYGKKPSIKELVRWARYK